MLRLKHHGLRIATVLWVLYCLAVLSYTAINYFHPETTGNTINYLESIWNDENEVSRLVTFICAGIMSGALLCASAVYAGYGIRREIFRNLFALYLAILALIGNFCVFVFENDLHGFGMALVWSGFLLALWYTTKKLFEHVEMSYAKVSLERLINGDISGYVNRKNAA